MPVLTAVGDSATPAVRAERYELRDYLLVVVSLGVVNCESKWPTHGGAQDCEGRECH